MKDILRRKNKWEKMKEKEKEGRKSEVRSKIIR